MLQKPEITLELVGMRIELKVNYGGGGIVDGTWQLNECIEKR